MPCVPVPGGSYQRALEMILILAQERLAQRSHHSQTLSPNSLLLTSSVLAGIFAFRTQVRIRAAAEVFSVSMPSRAFLLFGRTYSQPPRGSKSPVSMPSRAFLLFGLNRRRCYELAGSWFQCPRGHFCFSDCEKLLPSR